jgi:hypothetical protein
VRWGRSVLIGAAGVVVLVVAVLAVVVVRSLTVHEPSFPSLAAHPDPSITGTVAYVDAASECVHVVAAAGAPDKQVYCLPPFVPAKSPTEGKQSGPQLRWLSGGRLEVTMFRAYMGKDQPPTYGPGWQKVVDIRTGAVTDTPAASVPSTPDLTLQPATNQRGQTLTSTSERGHVRIALTDSTGTRTLMEAHGPSDYTYSLRTAFWSPDGQWAAADDGRILVVTTGARPVTRVLTGASKGGAFYGSDEPLFARFAVTGDNLLAAP